MMMAWVWAGMVGFSLIFSVFSGTTAAVGAAALDGAAEAVRLLLAMAGPILLWSGLMEVMRRSSLSDKLARLLEPLLCRLFPSARQDRELRDALGCNVSANLLGLGNAATPAGIRAALRLKKGECATDELCRLVILNSASLQLLPTTVAALRSGLGAENAFDILPAVWLSSAISVLTGLLMGRLFSRWL